MAEATKREPVLRTSYDEMEAYLLLPLINADEEYTISDIMSALSITELLLELTRR